MNVKLSFEKMKVQLCFFLKYHFSYTLLLLLLLFLLLLYYYYYYYYYYDHHHHHHKNDSHDNERHSLCLYPGK